MKKSPPLSQAELDDLEVGEREIASGKAKIFKTVEELLYALHNTRRK